MITREEVKMLISDIKKAHRLMNNVDKKISTCGVSRDKTPEWHVFNKSDFDHIVNLFGVMSKIERKSNFTEFSCIIEGVKIFCLESHNAFVV